MEPIKIFFSYASEDHSTVFELYDKFKALGIKPWMDKKDILPGEKWENSIWRAVNNSDFIILFLSNNSVNKRGFFQKEVKIALKLWEEKLEDDIFIIPIIIETCEIPISIKEIQWIDLKEEDSFNKIIQSIATGANKLGKFISYDPNYISIIEKKIQEYKNDELSYFIDVVYPQFEIIIDNNFSEVNQIISSSILEIVQNTRREGIQLLEDKEFLKEIVNYKATNSLYMNYHIEYISKKLLSVHFSISTYLAGAAHPLHNMLTLNFEINPTLRIKLNNLFSHNFDYLKLISEFCVIDLIKQFTGNEDYSYNNNPEDVSNDSFEWIRKGAAPKEENFTKFCLNEKSLIILFEDYQVGPYAQGLSRVEIPLELFKDNIINTTLVNEFFK